VYGLCFSKQNKKILLWEEKDMERKNKKGIKWARNRIKEFIYEAYGKREVKMLYYTFMLAYTIIFSVVSIKFIFAEGITRQSPFNFVMFVWFVMHLRWKGID
jgi:hypothetical protein